MTTRAHAHTREAPPLPRAAAETVIRSLLKPQLWGGGIGLNESILLNIGCVTLRQGSLARLRNGNSPAGQCCCQNDCSQSRPRDKTSQWDGETQTFELNTEQDAWIHQVYLLIYSTQCISTDYMPVACYVPSDNLISCHINCKNNYSHLHLPKIS